MNNLNIPFIDLHIDLFKQEVNPLDLFPMGLSGHYNKEGYDKISRIILKQQTNNLIYYMTLTVERKLIIK